MGLVNNTAGWIVAVLMVVAFVCGIYMLITGKVLLSYLTIGAGNFTEESKRAFSKPGGISLILGMSGITLFTLGIDGNSLRGVMIVIGVIMSIAAVVFYIIGRKRLVRE